MSKYKRVLINLTPVQHSYLKGLAARSNTSVSALVRDMIDKTLSQYPLPPSPYTHQMPKTHEI